MAEILEYTLVLLVSSLFVAGSVGVYAKFSSAESGVSAGAAFDEIHWLASRALENGSSEATLLLPRSTISCLGGLLTVGVEGSSENGTLPASCHFSVALDGGAHELRFEYDAPVLELTVG